MIGTPEGSKFSEIVSYYTWYLYLFEKITRNWSGTPLSWWWFWSLQKTWSMSEFRNKHLVYLYAKNTLSKKRIWSVDRLLRNLASEANLMNSLSIKTKAFKPTHFSTASAKFKFACNFRFLYQNNLKPTSRIKYDTFRFYTVRILLLRNLFVLPKCLFASNNLFTYSWWRIHFRISSRGIVKKFVDTGSYSDGQPMTRRIPGTFRRRYRRKNTD